MQRKFLAVATVALVFLFTVAFHLTVTQVALAQQTAVDPAAAETDAQPLPQPMRITFRQSIPLTVSVAGAVPLTASGNLTAEAASALMGTLLSNLGASSVAVTETAELTATQPGDAAATGESDAGVAEVAAQALLTPTTLTVVSPATDFAVVLTFEFDVVVTSTLTTTVPALVTVQVADNVSATMTLSATVAPQPDGELVVELLPVATPEVLTPTVEATAEATVEAIEVVTPTTPPVDNVIPAQIGDLAVIATSTVVTANLRSGPGTNFDQVTQVGPETPLGLVAISEDGQWYLLSNGAWIAGFLVADQPTTLPIATQPIIDQVSAAAAAAATPEVPGETTPEAATPAETPTPEAAPATPPTVTTNANVRSGPGTEFAIIGGTQTGQAITIVGRNADGTWFLLDFGAGVTGWVSAELVANPPALETVPVVNADGTPVEAAPAPVGGLALPTPTPVAPAPVADTTTTTTTTTITTTTAVADPATIAYLDSVTNLINSYDAALVALDALIAEARTTPAQLTGAAWIARLNTAVGQLRQANASVGELAPPAALATVQDNLVAAARQYTLAANVLVEASSTGVLTLLDTADEAIQSANASLTDAEAAIRQAGP